jgi:hypothetical protein
MKSLTDRSALRRAPLLAGLLLAAALQASRAAAQSPTDDRGWDGVRVQELMQRARERRQLPQRDTLLRNYRARAEGFVYFYLDRRETDERTLVKTDQVALEIFWAQPNRTKQRIVGLRDESRFPNRMYYHLDHLTVVQGGFGDVIRMGDGDEVADVPHPVAPGSDSIYAFRLADSLTITLPGQGNQIRVYEVDVRPRRQDRSALVGSLFIDRGTGDVVRMTFTFTPASYVDRRLDYISVSLDNGLWDGRYWLPNEQTLQIRRQIPELDFAAGAVIHGRMRITDYVFNEPLPPETFLGHPVVAVPEAERRQYEFEHGIYDDLNRAGLAAPADLSDVRREASALLGTPRLSGLPSWRLNLESASAALHYNRAEGMTPGIGVTYAPGAPWRADFSGGFAFGAERLWAAATVRRELPHGDAALRLQLRAVRDLGVAPGVPPVINSLTGMFAGDDYLDPYYATGARLTLRRLLTERLQVALELSGERHRTALQTQRSALFRESAEFRPIRPIDDADIATITGTLRRPAPDPRASAWGGAVHVEAGAWEGAEYVRPTVEARVQRASADQRRSLLLTGSGGYVTSGAPSQRLFMLGGTNTLPGYDYRRFAGRWYGIARAEATTTVFDPWIGLRLIAATGATGGLPETPAAGLLDAPAWTQWNVVGTDGLRTSVGAGVSLFWDLLRIDAVRGVNGGEWRLQFSFHRDFWDIS